MCCRTLIDLAVLRNRQPLITWPKTDRDGVDRMIVILTALQVEYEAVREHLVDVRSHHHAAGTVFDVGRLAAQPNRRIALATTGPGNLATATLTERAIAEFKPSAMMFVGVAGGLRGWLELGDVVTATRVYAYHGGRSEDEEFHTRPRSWEMSHALDQVARRLPRGNSWHALLPPSGTAVTPTVHFEAIAAGDVVLNSATSPLRQQLRHNYNDAVAIEMESAGFASAGHLNGHVPIATVRAISDRADGSKTTTDGVGWQRIAARNAAAFACALATQWEDKDDGHGRTDGRPVDPEPAAPLIQNIARDNARVGQQIGVVQGGMRVTSRRTGEER
jgi:nucleoside phosphorylase